MQDDDQVTEVTAEVDETENPNEETATSTSEDDTAEQKTDEQPKPKRDRSAAKRIGKLTAEKRAAERELAELRAKLESNQAPPATTEPPKRNDFDDYEDYLDARAEYKATVIADKKLAEVQRQTAEREQATDADRQVAAYNEARENLLDSGAEKYEDFEDVALSDDLPVTREMADAVLVSERGADVLYHLGKNPGVASRIAAMPPVRQLIELGKLEATLAPVKKASSAPSPTTSVTQRGAANNGLRDSMSTDDWMKRREAETRKQSQ